MKRLLIVTLTISTILLTACGSTPKQEVSNNDPVTNQSTDNSKSDDSKSEEPKNFAPLFADKENSSSAFSLVNESGDTAEGKSIIIYNSGTLAFDQIGLNYKNVDGSLITYIYVDGKESQKEQIGGELGQATLELQEEQLQIGTHYVEIIQYADNDTNTDPVTYEKIEYQVKQM